MWTVKTVDELRRHRRALTGSVAFVPTMGALHTGHITLMRAGKKLADHVVASIFVNPTQFGPTEDFSRYPRPLQRDLELCREAGVAGVFCPGVEEMYPPGQVECVLEVPQVAGPLEGEFRPGHFRGVCRVVAKLFNMVQPDVAVFGQKDYQQWKVLEAMTLDLAMPIRIVGHPTVREQDGLAMSSRNAYLNSQQRTLATGLFRALCQAREMIEQEGETDPAAVEAAMQLVLKTHQFQTQYAVIRHPRTLGRLDVIDPGQTEGVVALIAGKLGEVRLIDNMVIGLATSR